MTDERVEGLYHAALLDVIGDAAGRLAATSDPWLRELGVALHDLLGERSDPVPLR